MIRNEVLTHFGYLVTHPFGYGYHRRIKHCDLQNWCHVKPEQPPVSTHGQTPPREAYNDTPYAHTSTHRSVSKLRLLHPLFCEMCNKFILAELLFRLISYLGKPEGKGGTRLRSAREDSLRNCSERICGNSAPSTFRPSAGTSLQYYFQSSRQHLPEDNQWKIPLANLAWNASCPALLSATHIQDPSHLQQLKRMSTTEVFRSANNHQSAHMISLEGCQKLHISASKFVSAGNALAFRTTFRLFSLSHVLQPIILSTRAVFVLLHIYIHSRTQ
jgi:hypothetical protein